MHKATSVFQITHAGPVMIFWFCLTGAAVAETNRMHINHCGQSNAANVSIRVFNQDAAADASGLLYPGQGIDIACAGAPGQDECTGELLASDAESRDIISRDIELEDGEEYYVCADIGANVVNITTVECDCTFIGE